MAFLMLDKVLAPELIAGVVESSVRPYTLEHRLDLDRVLLDYIKVHLFSFLLLPPYSSTIYIGVITSSCFPLFYFFLILYITICLLEISFLCVMQYAVLSEENGTCSNSHFQEFIILELTVDLF